MNEELKKKDFTIHGHVVYLLVVVNDGLCILLPMSNY